MGLLINGSVATTKKAAAYKGPRILQGDVLLKDEIGPGFCIF
jgi:hypothetical protein